MYLGLDWLGTLLVVIILLFLLLLEAHHLHKTSNHLIISKLMCHFYLQHPPSSKQCDSLDVQWLFCLLESWSLVSSLTTFRLAWKTATLLALFTAKHCYDLTLLYIDNQHIFLQSNALNFILASGGKGLTRSSNISN